MKQYILRRIIYTIPVFIVLSATLFGLMRGLPGNPALLMSAAGEDALASPEIYEFKLKELGLDKPLFIQYGEWVWGIITRFDFGTSYWSKEPVTKELLARFPVTVELAVLTYFFSLLIGIPGGIISAIRHNTAPDYIVRLTSITFLALPNFWLGTLVIVLPAIWFGYFPPLGFRPLFEDPLQNLRQFIFPCIALGAHFSARTLRVTRSQMLEVLRQYYVRTAWAKGLSERLVIVRHALKNALIPVITVSGLTFAALLGGTAIIEVVFGLPGVGLLTLYSINQRDYPQVQANMLWVGMIFVVVNLIVDLTYGWLDPRIRYK